MQALFRALEPNHPRRIIRVFEWKTIRCPETGPSKQASLRNSARSLIKRRAEPVGNLNKGLPSAPRVAYPLMRHVHAQEPQSEHNRSQSQRNRLNHCTTVRNHDKSGPQPWPFPQSLHLFLLLDSTRGWPLLGLLTLPTAASERRANNNETQRVCTGVYVQFVMI